jgi:hypothetical protein
LSGIIPKNKASHGNLKSEESARSIFGECLELFGAKKAVHALLRLEEINREGLLQIHP